AATRPQIEDVCAADDAEDDHDRRLTCALVARVMQQARLAASPDDLLRGGADLRTTRPRQDLDAVPRPGQRTLCLPADCVQAIGRAGGRGLHVSPAPPWPSTDRRPRRASAAA